MPSNLFVQYHESCQDGLPEDTVGTGWEDTFTEALCFFLTCDREALASLCRAILAGDFEEPVSVETQFRENTERPDVLVLLRSGRRLFLENKFDAVMQPRQIERYLELRDAAGGSPFVALLARRTHEVPAQALGDSNYKRPSGRPHFFWQDDLFPLLSSLPADRGTAALRSFFRDYMSRLGLSQSDLSKKWQLLFEDKTVEENREVQQQFGRRLSGVGAFLRKAGFEVSGVSHKGLRATPTQASPYLFLKVGPRRTPRGSLGQNELDVKDEALSVSLIYEGGGKIPHAEAARASFPNPFVDSLGRKWCVAYPYKFSKGKRTRLEFVTNLDWYLSDESAIEARLRDSCRDVISQILAAVHFEGTS